MTATYTRSAILHWMHSLCIDTESTITVGGKTATGTIVEIWDETYDRPDYAYTFTIDGEEADIVDILDLANAAD